MRSNARRPAAVAAAAIVMTGLVGLAHAPFARSLLQTLGGCPMAGARITPEVAERARRLALATEPAALSAPARPALGFALDRSTHDEVRAWARRQRVECDDARPGLMKCARVAPEAIGSSANGATIDELALEFDPNERLVNMTTFRTHMTPAAASARARAIVAWLSQTLGPAELRAGDFAESSLRGPAEASISTARYRFDDYVADVTAMNAPGSGPSIREHYMSAKD
jgi:hypothetical protein